MIFNTMNSILLFLLVLAATASQDLGRTATLIVKHQTHQDLKNKSFNLTAASSSAQTISAKHQLIHVFLADPLGGCSELPSIAEVEYKVYLLVQGRDGGCTYAQKVKWAKKSLVRGLIIVDSEKGTNNLRPGRNDNFHTFLMPEAEGDLLLKDLSSSSSSDFLAQLNIGDEKELEKGKVQIWVSSLNKESYQLLAWFERALAEVPLLGEYLDWRPRFALVSSKRAISGSGSGQFASSCACEGSFCSPQFHGRSSNVLVREDIRQSLIFRDHPQDFLAYMRLFEARCLSNYLQTNFSDDCAANLLTQLGIDPSGLSARIDSFLLTCGDSGQSLSIFSDMMLDRSKLRHISNYPVIVLNHEQVSATSQNNLKEVFCRKLGLEKEGGCSAESTSRDTFRTIVAGFFWVVVVVVLMGVGALVVIYFRVRLRKEVSKQLTMQVSTAVEHYYQLSETTQNK